MLVGPHGARGRRGGALVGGIGVALTNTIARPRRPGRERARALGDLLGSTATRIVRPPACARRPRPRIAFDHGNEIAPHPQVRAGRGGAFRGRLESLAGDEADARALAFEQRIGADGRAMHDGGESAIRPSASSPATNPLASSPRCDGVLAVAKRPVVGFVRHEIGESAADVDADEARRVIDPARRNRRVRGLWPR